MTPSEFRADCSNCAALCCLALAFDRGEMFAHDKPAGTPCHRLGLRDSEFACSIHEDLAQKGYRGCVAFDCLGAGQRVSALFSDTWKSRPELTAPMMEAFRIMRQLQELHQMLTAARALPLPEDKLAELSDRIAQVDTAKRDLESLHCFDPKPARDWLKSLAPFISRQGA
ncbi:hypothetical protein [Celeribacter neptunius]|uniref:Pentapeptide repeat-containing protein n=1 Tax=Celeribacter neptunius TaxID=588602 RepID=A0A1I3VEE0_9RHOB|nr:hypothetical protein [Celeribacter neptunius]SFJ93738.1 hypothetical protein SAMN04487991_3335 [Celeribacter neptunius]